MATILGEDGGDDFDFFALRGPDVLPVPHGSGMGDDESNSHHGVLDTDAPVGPTSKDEVVSGVGVSRAVWI